VKVIFERDSVCAGDDVWAPNRKVFDSDEPPLFSELCGGEHALAYLPSVSGSRTKWAVIINSSIVAYVWHSYALVRNVEIELLEQDKITDVDRLFFQYDGQQRHSINSEAR
jgi:hypothetical protein